jgi:hypothetical protein
MPKLKHCDFTNTLATLVAGYISSRTYIHATELSAQELNNVVDALLPVATHICNCGKDMKKEQKKAKLPKLYPFDKQKQKSPH